MVVWSCHMEVPAEVVVLVAVVVLAEVEANMSITRTIAVLGVLEWNMALWLCQGVPHQCLPTMDSRRKLMRITRTIAVSGVLEWNISKVRSKSATSNSADRHEPLPGSYVDNAYNRSIGRVGMERGSKVMSKSSSGRASPVSDTYVDNSYNRKVGRAGQPKGTAVISKGELSQRQKWNSGNVSDFDNYSRSRTASSDSPKVYKDNSLNRKLGRIEKPLGSASFSRKSNNDSVGRVGMEHGSMVMPRSSTSMPSNYGFSPKTYADNAYNRSVGRVGMEHGSMVRSKSATSNSADRHEPLPGSYVDNAYNRSIGRVGMERGSKVMSKSSSGRASPVSDTYVDNSYNRRVGRAGQPKGTAVISKGELSQRQKWNSGNVSDFDNCSRSRTASSDSPKVYKDNSLNRKLGRVGKPLGSASFSRKSNNDSVEVKTYVDNSLNRSLGRVGKPLGSMPVSRKSRQSQMTRDILKRIKNDTYSNYDSRENYNIPPDGYDFDEEEFEEQDYRRPIYDHAVEDDDLQTFRYDREAEERATRFINRKMEEFTFAEENGDIKPPTTARTALKGYAGKEINFKDIELRSKIGSGGFGDVYFAIWKETCVAVKKLRVQRVSQKRFTEFTKEVFNFCDLDHPNIISFIGACVVTPNLAIVMEYMHMSLFDALHINEEIDLSENDRLFIIMQICTGLEYLHSKKIAHCDLKSQNILLNYKPEEELCVAKITDFGLSMIKSNQETSTTSQSEVVRNIGTPRFSAPEVLRGEYLSVSDLMKSDVYSLSLIIFEIIYEEEPFYNLTYAQLRKQIGENGKTPEIHTNVIASANVKALLECCWNFIPGDRPSIRKIQIFLDQLQTLYDIVE